MVDSRHANYINDVEKNLSNFIKNNNNKINFKIVSSFNWCGRFFTNSLELLNNNANNYSYIGEHIPPENLQIEKNNIKHYNNYEFINNGKIQ